MLIDDIVYTFKKGFSGYVVELIGEFDLIISKPLYYLYNISFKVSGTVVTIWK